MDKAIDLGCGIQVDTGWRYDDILSEYHLLKV